MGLKEFENILTGLEISEVVVIKCDNNSLGGC